MKWYFALGLVFIVCGTVMSTSAVPLSEPADELNPVEETEVALAPADTPNGDRYADFGSNGELVISVDVISGTQTKFDDVFVVSFEGVEGSDEAARLQIKHDSEWLDIYTTDAGTRESVDEPGNTLTLDPGEQATLGFVVTTDSDSPTSLSETVTYKMEIPDTEANNGGGDGGSSGSGGGDDNSAGGGGGTDASGGDGDDTDASGGDGDDTDTSGGDGDDTDTSGGDGDDTDTSGGDGGAIEPEDSDGDEATDEQVTATQPAYLSPEETLGGFLVRTILLLTGFVATGAGTFTVVRHGLQHISPSE